MVRIINCVFVLLGQVITHFIHTGLLGTSAARHLATNGAGLGRPLSVVLVGPEETGPAVPPSNEGRSIFAAHLDEGRITRVIDPVRIFFLPVASLTQAFAWSQDKIWSLLAERSISRYRDIESESGLPFYHPIGFLAIVRFPPPPPQKKKNTIH